MLVAGIEIKKLKTIPLDMAVLEVELSELPDKQMEYKKASSLCSTVKDSLIKSDIAEMLSQRWGKPLDEVKEYLAIDSKTASEKSSVAKDIDDIFDNFYEFVTSGSTGLGFKSIDESLGGIKNTECVGLAAYSNHGKSFIAAKIAAYRIVREKNNVLIFSMEMPRGQFLQSIIQEILHISSKQIYDYIKTDKGLEIYTKVKDAIGKRLRIVDDGNKSMKDVFDIVTALNDNDFHVDFVIFDHFHLIPNISDFSTFENNANLMKVFVNRFKCPLLMLAQFNDVSQQRGAKKIRPPIPADIKGPDSFIAACDIVLLVYRPYLMEDGTSSIEKEELKYATMIKIGKSRREIMGARLFRYDYNPDDSSMNEHEIVR